LGKASKLYLYRFARGISIGSLSIPAQFIGFLISLIWSACTDKNEIPMDHIPRVVFDSYLFDKFSQLPSGAHNASMLHEVAILSAS